MSGDNPYTDECLSGAPVYYTLKNKEVVPCDLKEWSEFFNSEDRILARTTIGEVGVSTVFLGLDHGFGMTGEPLVFETMVFGGKYDQDMVRYVSYEEAMAGHQDMLRLVKTELPWWERKPNP